LEEKAKKKARLALWEEGTEETTANSWGKKAENTTKNTILPIIRKEKLDEKATHQKSSRESPDGEDKKAIFTKESIPQKK